MSNLRGASSMSGMASKELKREEKPIPGLDELKRQAERIGFGPEIKDLVNDIEELRDQVRRKNLELALLEVAAMESRDENVTDLREQLFTTVKLIHGEEIEEILNDDNIMDRFGDFNGFHVSPRNVTSSSPTEKEELKNNMLTRLRRNWDNYKELRKEVKLTKKNWKRNTPEDEDGYDEPMSSPGW